MLYIAAAFLIYAFTIKGHEGDKSWGLILGGVVWALGGLFDTEHPINILIGIVMLGIGVA